MKEQKFNQQANNEPEVTESELLENEAAEQAYKAEMQTEIPDLWDRIEAALPEKNSSDMNIQAETEEISQEQKVIGGKKILSFRTIRTAALIAACLCITFMIPTILSLGKHSGAESATSAEAPMETAAAEEASAQDTAAAETVEEETPATDAFMEEAASADEAVSAGEATEEMLAADAAEPSGATDMTAASKEQMQELEKNQASAERNDYGSDALYTENVKLEIIACDTERGKDDDGYVTYTVMILEDASDMYEMAATFDVYVDEKQAQGIEAGDKLTVTLVNPDPLSSAVPHISMLLTD
ncbi:MAG: hypothetical protein Q4G60_09915 [bacterium]|nr:hypothetical protein [bacterium]